MRNVKIAETSIIANQNKTAESKQRDYDRILNALHQIGSGTYEDIAKAMKEKELNVVSRRISEMREKGMIRNTGLKKRTSRGCPAFIHEPCAEVPSTPAKLVDDMIKQATIKTINPLFGF